MKQVYRKWEYVKFYGGGYRPKRPKVAREKPTEVANNAHDKRLC